MCGVLSNLFKVRGVNLYVVVFDVLVFTFVAPLRVGRRGFSGLDTVVRPRVRGVRGGCRNGGSRTSVVGVGRRARTICRGCNISPANDYMRLTVRVPVLFTLCRIVCQVPTCIKDMGGVFANMISGLLTMGKCASVLRRFVASRSVAQIHLIVSDTKGTADGSVISFLCTLSPSR